MSSSPVIVFQALSHNQQPAATLVEALKHQDGFQRAHFGVKMEDPETGILCTEWCSRETALRYRSSELVASLGVKETLGISVPGEQQQQQQGWHSILGAPCTEVFTAFGAEEGFVGNVERFMAAVEANPPEGYRGAAFGESVDLDAKGADGGREKVVRMVIGWTSRDAHLEAKAKPGAIQDNIHELRALRKAVDLFHVEFKEL